MLGAARQRMEKCLGQLDGAAAVSPVVAAYWGGIVEEIYSVLYSAV